MVIKVHARIRIGTKDFIEAIRTSLTDFYGPKKLVVGMGGTFRIINGKIKSHVMPGFCQVFKVNPVYIFILFQNLETNDD